jgi:hypothetical protein
VDCCGAAELRSCGVSLACGSGAPGDWCISSGAAAASRGIGASGEEKEAALLQLAGFGVVCVLCCVLCAVCCGWCPCWLLVGSW